MPLVGCYGQLCCRCMDPPITPLLMFQSWVKGPQHILKTLSHVLWSHQIRPLSPYYHWVNKGRPTPCTSSVPSHLGLTHHDASVFFLLHLSGVLNVKQNSRFRIHFIFTQVNHLDSAISHAAAATDIPLTVKRTKMLVNKQLNIARFPKALLYKQNKHAYEMPQSSQIPLKNHDPPMSLLAFSYLP